MKVSRITLIGAAAASLTVLGGCATVSSTNAAIGAPSQKQTANLKGRAFKVGQITTMKKVEYVGGIYNHCLPNQMYIAMLRHDLKVAFKHEGLTKGQGPAIPVNLKLKLISFQTNKGWKSSQLAAKVTFSGHSLMASQVGAGAHYWTNGGPAWTWQQRIIPAMTVDIVRGLKNIQNGKAFKHGFSGFGGANLVHFVPGTYKTRTLPIGILYPIPRSQMARITGKSTQQLNAICQANIKAGKIVKGQ